MSATVAIVHVEDDYAAALRQAVDLLGGIGPLNTPEREVTIKVGIFDPKSRHHTCTAALDGIIRLFDRAPRVLLAESDNYCGKALDRMQTCYGGLFSERVTPYSLSGQPGSLTRCIAGEDMDLAPALFKPNVLVSTHILRTFSRGSLLKNLFGCTPMVQKAKHHKNEIFSNLLADLFEASGGIDLAVMDATSLYHNATEKRVALNALIVSRDAVAAETVGALIAGLKPEKLPQLQEFARRGLGETDMAQIEIVGISPAEFAALKQARKQLKKLVDAAPRAPGISDTIDQVTQEGWMDTPRTAEEVAAELQGRGVGNATKQMVDTTLKRRAGKTLERIRDDGRWVYRRKQD